MDGWQEWFSIGAAQEWAAGESVFSFSAPNLNKSVNDRDQTCIRIPFVDSPVPIGGTTKANTRQTISAFRKHQFHLKRSKPRLICERSLVNVCLSPDWSWVSTHFPSSYKKRMAAAVKTEEDIQCSSSHYFHFHFSLKV